MIQTETKVMGSILALTLVVIIGGVVLFNKNNPKTSSAPGDYSQYIEKSLILDSNKVARDYNPRIVGPKSLTQATTTSKITVTEFLDYECPACATNGEPIVRNLLAHYGDNITIIRKIFPVHGQPSIDVGRLVLASQIFGLETYEKIHTKMFETQKQWAILGKDDRDAFIKKLIIELGVDYDKLLTEANTDKYLSQIQQDKQDATDLGIKATPSFVVNGTIRITGGLPINEFYKVIDSK